MKAYLFIGEDKIGQVDFSIVDGSMGCIGGYLIPADAYKKYQPTIQQYVEKQGVSNSTNFNFRILLEDNTELQPAGGISIADSVDFNEIYVDAAGLDLSKF